MWDIRNSKKPVNVAENLESINPETNVIFSPDERLIMTGMWNSIAFQIGMVHLHHFLGTSVPKGQGYGKLVMLDRQTLEIRRTMSKLPPKIIQDTLFINLDLRYNAIKCSQSPVASPYQSGIIIYSMHVFFFFPDIF